jgi:hypothetical protein
MSLANNNYKRFSKLNDIKLYFIEKAIYFEHTYFGLHHRTMNICTECVDKYPKIHELSLILSSNDACFENEVSDYFYL